MDAASIARVRRFNRTVTERIGALADEYLSRRRPLGASRLLWEIGDDAVDVRSIRTRLDLDSGYLSRLLAGLEAEGLVMAGPAPHDQRVRRVELTAAGRAELAVLEQASDELAWSLLEPLGAERAQQLVEAMDIVEGLLRIGAVEVTIEDPTGPAARFCIQSYFSELDALFDGGFDPAAGISADPEELVPPAGLLLVARLHGDPVGCGALKFRDHEPAEIKRMWVSPDARGHGLGRRLLRELETRAKDQGVRNIRLETNGSLTTAIAMYRSAGYIEVAAFNDEPYAHHWFEKDLHT